MNATRKIAKPLSAETAKEIVAGLSHWHVHVPAADDVLGAIGIRQSRIGVSDILIKDVEHPVSV